MPPYRRQPIRLPHPWDSPGKNTGVGCHFLLQNIASAAAAAKSLQSCPTPSDPMDCSLPGSSVHGIIQVRVLEWGAIAFWSTLNPWEFEKNVGAQETCGGCSAAQSCLTPSDPMDCSPPGSPVHGIFQARALEWLAIAFSGMSIY